MEIHHKLHPRIGDCLRDARQVFVRSGQRFLDDYSFARARRFLDDFSMREVRRNDRYGVDFSILQHLSIVGIDLAHAVLRRNFARPLLAEVAYRGQRSTRMLSVGLSVDVTPGAGADQCYSNPLQGTILPFLAGVVVPVA